MSILFKEKFIAFVDILGFKDLVEEAEVGPEASRERLVRLINSFHSAENREAYAQHGPTCCPNSSYIQQNLDFQLTQISDCAVISTEVSPVGMITLIQYARGITLRLLKEGALCRGYICRGKIHHTPHQFIGSGYQNALDNEKSISVFKSEADEGGPPYIEIAPSLLEYIQTSTDACVKKLFDRLTLSGEEKAAIFPFKVFPMLYGSDATTDPGQRKNNIQLVRTEIQKLIELVQLHSISTKPRDLQKVQHYIKALEEQLLLCDKSDRNIDRGCALWPAFRYGPDGY